METRSSIDDDTEGILAAGKPVTNCENEEHACCIESPLNTGPDHIINEPSESDETKSISQFSTTSYSLPSSPTNSRSGTSNSFSNTDSRTTKSDSTNKSDAETNHDRASTRDERDCFSERNSQILSHSSSYSSDESASDSDGSDGTFSCSGSDDDDDYDIHTANSDDDDESDDDMTMFSGVIIEVSPISSAGLGGESDDSETTSLVDRAESISDYGSNDDPVEIANHNGAESEFGDASARGHHESSGMTRPTHARRSRSEDSPYDDDCEERVVCKLCGRIYEVTKNQCYGISVSVFVILLSLIVLLVGYLNNKLCCSVDKSVVEDVDDDDDSRMNDQQNNLSNCPVTINAQEPPTTYSSGDPSNSSNINNYSGPNVDGEENRTSFVDSEDSESNKSEKGHSESKKSEEGRGESKKSVEKDETEEDKKDIKDKCLDVVTLKTTETINDVIVVNDSLHQDQAADRCPLNKPKTVVKLKCSSSPGHNSKSSPIRKNNTGAPPSQTPKEGSKTGGLASAEQTNQNLLTANHTEEIVGSAKNVLSKESDTTPDKATNKDKSGDGGGGHASSKKGSCNMPIPKPPLGIPKENGNGDDEQSKKLYHPDSMGPALCLDVPIVARQTETCDEKPVDNHSCEQQNVDNSKSEDMIPITPSSKPDISGSIETSGLKSVAQENRDDIVECKSESGAPGTNIGKAYDEHVDNSESKADSSFYMSISELEDKSRIVDVIDRALSENEEHDAISIVQKKRKLRALDESDDLLNRDRADYSIQDESSSVESELHQTDETKSAGGYSYSTRVSNIGTDMLTRVDKKMNEASAIFRHRMEKSYYQDGSILEARQYMNSVVRAAGDAAYLGMKQFSRRTPDESDDRVDAICKNVKVAENIDKYIPVHPEKRELKSHLFHLWRLFEEELSKVNDEVERVGGKTFLFNLDYTNFIEASYIEDKFTQYDLDLLHPLLKDKIEFDKAQADAVSILRWKCDHKVNVPEVQDFLKQKLQWQPGHFFADDLGLHKCGAAVTLNSLTKQEQVIQHFQNNKPVNGRWTVQTGFCVGEAEIQAGWTVLKVDGGIVPRGTKSLKDILHLNTEVQFGKAKTYRDTFYEKLISTTLYTKVDTWLPEAIDKMCFVKCFHKIVSKILISSKEEEFSNSSVIGELHKKVEEEEIKKSFYNQLQQRRSTKIYPIV